MDSIFLSQAIFFSEVLTLELCEEHGMQHILDIWKSYMEFTICTIHGRNVGRVTADHEVNENDVDGNDEDPNDDDGRVIGVARAIGKDRDGAG